MRRLDVAQGGGEVEPLHHGEGVTHARLVVALEPRRQPPEHVRHEHDVPVSRQLLGHSPHVVVDAEDLLEEEEARPRPPSGTAQKASKLSPPPGDNGLVAWCDTLTKAR